MASLSGSWRHLLILVEQPVISLQAWQVVACQTADLGHLQHRTPLPGAGQQVADRRTVRTSQLQGAVHGLTHRVVPELRGRVG